MRMFKLFLVYLILIAYSVEILLFTFTTDQQKSMVDIKNTRIEIAKKRNIKYDTRSAEEFFFDSKKIHKDLEPRFYYSSCCFSWCTHL